MFVEMELQLMIREVSIGFFDRGLCVGLLYIVARERCKESLGIVTVSCTIAV